MTEVSTAASVTDLLQQGEIEMQGLVTWGSNYTFLVRVKDPAGELEAIYKPSQGERPLWDFARGTLCMRERAAFLISEQLGWHLVPPTVLRDGPHGWGSLQYFVEHDPKQHYLTLRGQYVEQERRIALFDVLINNADRKSGHVLLDTDNRLWAIDHGVSFHATYKLRSVIWEYAGEPIGDEMLSSLVALHSWLCYGSDPTLQELGDLLSRNELEALSQRAESLIERPVFPTAGPGRSYPWPLV